MGSLLIQIIIRHMRIYIFLVFSLLFVGCGSTAEPASDELVLPTIAAVDHTPLAVVATTSIIGDVIDNVGGEQIDLTILIGRNQDAHNYEATPADLVALESADIIFVNGWGLEEGLAEMIAENYGEKMVPISAGIVPREPVEEADDDHDHDHEEEHDDEHDHGAADPHVWLLPANVAIWTRNVATIFSAAAPTHATDYATNRDQYLVQIEALTAEIDAQLDLLPIERRKLVTNHDSFGYFADAYDFELIGTVIPSLSTSAEPSASDLATLIEAMRTHQLCTIFSETTTSPALAETVAAELDNCSAVAIIPLYTSALDESVPTWLDMMRYNVTALTTNLASP